MEKAAIIFRPEGKRVDVELGTSVLDASRAASVDLESLCGGEGTCGKCKVIINRGAENLSRIGENERNLLSESLVSKGYRLACSSIIDGTQNPFLLDGKWAHLLITVPKESRRGFQQILINGIISEEELDPIVKKYYVEVSKPTLEDSKSDVERVKNTLCEKYGLRELDFSYNVLRKISGVLRKNDWKIDLIVWNDKEIISVEPKGRKNNNKYGFAIDLGTSTIVGYLVNITTGKIVSVGALPNPQAAYGEDIVTRLEYSLRSQKNLYKLNNLVVKSLNEIIGETCLKVGVKRNKIYDVTIVGNTLMHHLVLKINPRSLSRVPFNPAIRRGINIEAVRLGLKVNPGAYVYVLPVIAGFVGADNIGVMLSTGLYNDSEITLAVDVGTNGEIILGNCEHIEVCSCAAGPALEGAHIKHGMCGLAGAIERVDIDPETFDVEYHTIGNIPPIGVCGSGIVDAIAEMIEAGIVLKDGRINVDLKTPRIRMTDDGSEFVLVWGSESGKGMRDIVITQDDIRQIQLAKAAFYAGTKILMDRRGVNENNIDRVYVAGAFGNYLDKENAKKIGLLPDVDLNAIKNVGNAAGMGAVAALKSKRLREVAEKLSEKVSYLEIATTEEFEREFFLAMHFPHYDIERFPSLKKV